MWRSQEFATVIAFQRPLHVVDGPEVLSEAALEAEVLATEMTLSRCRETPLMQVSLQACLC